MHNVPTWTNAPWVNTTVIRMRHVSTLLAHTCVPARKATSATGKCFANALVSTSAFTDVVLARPISSVNVNLAGLALIARKIAAAMDILLATKESALVIIAKT